MIPSKIVISLNSAATFGRGDGVAGLVDREIEHDRDGFPYLRGKTLKGLLAESAENIIFFLRDAKEWRDAKNQLFGMGGRGQKERGSLHISDAQLPEALRHAVKQAKWPASDVLYSLTGIRRQTAINEHGAPDHASLRSMRVLLPGVVLEAAITFETGPSEPEKQLLAAAVLDFRHAGTGRNRGRGWLTANLDNADATKTLFEAFGDAIQ